MYNDDWNFLKQRTGIPEKRLCEQTHSGETRGKRKKHVLFRKWGGVPWRCREPTGCGRKKEQSPFRLRQIVGAPECLGFILWTGVSH